MGIWAPTVRAGAVYCARPRGPFWNHPRVCMFVAGMTRDPGAHFADPVLDRKIREANLQAGLGVDHYTLYLLGDVIAGARFCHRIGA